jgi:hypothetical protein
MKAGSDRMKIPTLPFTVTDWSGVPSTVHLGETGQATWRTFTIGDLRVRLVEYSAGYMADHWCDLGHVLYVVMSSRENSIPTFVTAEHSSCGLV